MAHMRQGPERKRLGGQPPLLPPMSVQVPRGFAQQGRAVVEASKSGVALAAEQLSHRVGGVAMIDAERLEGPDLAVRAKTVLADDHPLEILRGESVFRHPPAVREASAILLSELRIGVPVKALVLVDVFPMRSFPLAILRKFSRSIVRILRISFPGPLPTRAHLAARRRKLRLGAARRRIRCAAARRFGARKRRRARRRSHGMILGVAGAPRRTGSQPARARRSPGRSLRVASARRSAFTIGSRRRAAALGRGRSVRLTVDQGEALANWRRRKRKTRAAGAGGRNYATTISPFTALVYGCQELFA